MPYKTGDNNYGIAKWIVDPVLGQGTHTTWTAAIASASAGDSIGIRPGTYVENPTGKAGVNIFGMPGDAEIGNVILNGKFSYSGSGAVSLANIAFQTNNDYFLEVTGANNSTVYLSDCQLGCSNHTGINNTSSGSSVIFVYNCNGGLATTGIGLYNIAAASGGILFSECQISNGGNSVTASNVSSGVTNFFNTQLNIPISTSGTGFGTMYNSYLNTSVQNTTPFTTAGTGNFLISNSSIYAGSASAVNVGTGTTVTATQTNLSSTNTNVVTGGGTFNQGGNVFSNTSFGVNVTTNNFLPTSSFSQGTFTPTITFGGASTGITYSRQDGRYTKIGKMVMVNIDIILTNKGSSTGVAAVAGLPFSADTACNQAACVADVANLTLAALNFSVTAVFGGTVANLFSFSSTGAGLTNLTNSTFANNSIICFQGIFFTT